MMGIERMIYCLKPNGIEELEIAEELAEEIHCKNEYEIT